MSTVISFAVENLANLDKPTFFAGTLNFLKVLSIFLFWWKMNCDEVIKSVKKQPQTKSVGLRTDRF